MYAKKEPSLAQQKKNTIDMLRQDFKIHLTGEQLARINSATSNRQVERIGVDIIKSAPM
jgi:hypothetical protein